MNLCLCVDGGVSSASLKQWPGFYLSVRSEFHQLYPRFILAAFLTGDRMIEAVRVLTLIARHSSCLSGLCCNASTFDQGCENLKGSNKSKMAPFIESKILL